MNAACVLASQALLALCLLCTRPPLAGAVLRSRLLLQMLLLLVALLARALAGGGVAVPASVCALAVILQSVLLVSRWRRWPEPSVPAAAGPSWWPVGCGVLAIWLAFRVLPGQGSPLPATALAIVLCGSIGLLAAPSGRLRLASMLSAGHGLLLLAGSVRGSGWAGLAMAASIQAAVLVAFCRRPVWSDAVDDAVDDPVGDAGGAGRVGAGGS